MTGTSTLDPDNFPEAPDRSLGKGHGVDSLGPSDISDSGSDVVGGFILEDEDTKVTLRGTKTTTKVVREVADEFVDRGGAPMKMM